jgi:Ca2+-binding EF-hand superfamily protein
MTIRACIVTVAFALSISASAAVAQSPALEHFMETWDGNGDGTITLQEIREARERLFPAFDGNGDGFLNQEEYAEFDKSRSAGVATSPPEERAKMKQIAGGLSLARNDANGDGRVSLAEFLVGSETWFMALDKDGDGGVTLRDLSQ